MPSTTPSMAMNTLPGGVAAPGSVPEDTGTHAGHELNLPSDNVDKVGVREQRQNAIAG
jgi:hypothetical protein